MKNILIVLILLSSVSKSIGQQRYFTKNGTISFEAGTSIEDIDAVNKSVTSVFDPATGQIEFAVLVKGFEFKRALMQEHFNENYMESNKYPKSVFKGKIANSASIDLHKDGSYPVKVKGILEMHGVKKEVDVTGTLLVKGEQIISSSSFSVLFEDYGIAIPGVVKDKISKDVKIVVDCSYSPLK